MDNFNYLYLTDYDEKSIYAEKMAEWAQIAPRAVRYQTIENYVARVEEGLAIVGENSIPLATERLMGMVDDWIAN